MTQVYVGIGSNVEPEANINGGLRALEARFGKLEVSPVYRAPSHGFDGDDFFNLAAGFETGAEVEAVESALKDIERAHGRQRNETRFSSRTLDIDLLLFGDMVRFEGRIKVPRADIVEYDFVLCPLADIAADVIHPATHESIAALWAAFDRSTSRLEEARIPGMEAWYESTRRASSGSEPGLEENLVDDTGRA